MQTVDLCGELELPIFVYFSINLPGENADTYQETLDLARRVAERYPPGLLRMANMFHTIDPGSPMDVEPERYGLRTRWTSFLDYYRYCQQSTEAADDLQVAALRGFEAVEQPPLTQMYEQWVELCRELGEQTCRHFP